MSSPKTPVTSRSGPVRGRKRINPHPINLLRLENPWKCLKEWAKIDSNGNFDEDYNQEDQSDASTEDSLDVESNES